MSTTGGSFGISDKESIDALHKTIRESIIATTENSKSMKRLTGVAIFLTAVQTVATVVPIWPSIIAVVR